MDLQSNPPKMYRNFDSVIAEGEKGMIEKPGELKKETEEENVDEL